MMTTVEAVDLTEAQARELAEAARGAERMYDDRKGGGAIARKLGLLASYVEEARDEGGGEVAFGLGMAGEGRERLARIVQNELKMEERKHGQGWGKDGNELRALRNAVSKMLDPEVQEEDL